MICARTGVVLSSAAKGLTEDLQAVPRADETRVFAPSATGLSA